ncbi:MAG: hypothetical protein IJ445_00165 [Clostridia bacterium]|nr:hypothetical protein [Clostridia bacterium]
MNTADIYYYGCESVEDEVDEECEELMQQATTLERRVIESLDDNKRDIFSEYAKIMKKVVARKGYLSFDKGFSMGINLAQ